MYEVIDTRTKEVYRAHNVAELRTIVEENITLPDDLPSAYHDTWSNSRCVKYLIQAGYIVPYNGPEWFMRLQPPNTDESDGAVHPIHSEASLTMLDIDGSQLQNQALITLWRSRNHVRLVFKDPGEVKHEIFMTEEGLRDMWVLIGKMLGFNGEGLAQVIRDVLPPLLLHYPQIPPENFPAKSSNTDAFNILDAINSLDIGLEVDSVDPDATFDEDDEDY